MRVVRWKYLVLVSPSSSQFWRALSRYRISSLFKISSRVCCKFSSRFWLDELWVEFWRCSMKACSLWIMRWTFPKVFLFHTLRADLVWWNLEVKVNVGLPWVCGIHADSTTSWMDESLSHIDSNRKGQGWVGCGGKRWRRRGLWSKWRGVRLKHWGT